MAFFLDFMPASSMNGGSCGCSGCKNNTMASPMYPIQKGNELLDKKFKENKKEIEKLEKQLSKDSKIETIPNTLHVKVGLGDMRSCETVAELEPFPTITDLTDGNPKWGFIPSSKGACKRTVFTQPIITDGIDCKEVTGEYIRKIGSGGVAFDTSGRIAMNASTVSLCTTKGELLLNSPNKTIIGGANIVLDSKGHHNGDAIILNSDRVYVGGKLSVQGDIALKGSLMMDGGIYVPHITCPGERIDTDVSSSAHNVHSAPNWNNPLKPDATRMDIFDKLYKSLRDICAVLTKLVITPDFLKTKIEETFSTAAINVMIDGQGLPTGFAMIYEYTTYTPIPVYGVCTFGGAVTGFVQPSMIPIYNWTHNHGSPGDPHVHGYTALKSVTHGNAAASIASRQTPSAIPTPALTQGMGSSPGHKNAGDLGPCGGGGGPFGNANRVRSSKLRRNRAYGIDSDDAFAGGDYVNITPKFTEDGILIPTPKTNILDCD